MFALSPLIGLLACMSAHVIVSRAAPALPRLQGVVWSVVAGLGTVTALGMIFARLAAGSRADRWGSVTAWGLAYLAFAYTYVFGFFNLGESARRIRLLIELHAAGARGMSLEDVLAAYNARIIIDARLRRMLAAGEITERDGRYVMRRSLMLSISKMLVMAKVVLLGAPSEFGGGPARAGGEARPRFRTLARRGRSPLP